ncbi:hypothetical protein DYI25_17700 [Mesobacillus boroniphilus]|uniref:Uncharacterized protein n=2 Tax=Mesobacillus boroniphilus TaxID=308892 RepID=A0A944GYY2_9BACI|nr:hypothetical protein [Mesobacillus boroniphilus]
MGDFFMQIRILVLLILSSFLVNGCLPTRNMNDPLPLSKMRTVITNKEILANNSYRHLNERKISSKTLELDSARWKAEVEPLIGQTNIFIFPFGSSVLPGDEKFSTLQDYRFTIFCSVGPDAYIPTAKRYALMDRVHIDGIALQQQKDITDRFFNSEEVIDEARYR